MTPKNGYEFDEQEMPGDTQMQTGPRPPGAGGPPQGAMQPRPSPVQPMQNGNAPVPAAPMPGGPKPPMPGAPPPQPGPPGAGGPPGAAPPQQGGGQPEENDEVARVLWERANQLQPQDLQALGRAINREAGLILLKIIPELAPIILEGPQMQGPEMQEIRGHFGHDDFMGQMRSKQAPSANAPGAAPPTGRSASGLRAI